MLGGVLGGLAEYLSVDPNLLRLVYIALLFIGDLASALIGVYILAWIIIPQEPAEGVPGESVGPRFRSEDVPKIILLLFAAGLVIYGVSILFDELGQLIIFSVYSFAEMFSRIFFGPWYVVVEGVKINLSKLLLSLVAIVIGLVIILKLRKRKVV